MSSQSPAIHGALAIACSDDADRLNLRSSDDGFALLDQSGRFVHANSRVTALLGVPLHELVGRPFWDLSSKLTGIPDKEICRRLFESGTREHIACKVAFTGRHLDLQIAPLPECTALFWNELLEQASAPALKGERPPVSPLADRYLPDKLEQGRRHVFDSLENIPDAFAEVDHNWRVVFINSAALRLSGKTAEEVLGKELWDVYPQILGTSVETAYRTTMEKRVAVRFEMIGLVSGRWIESSLSPTPHGLTVCTRDIHDRKLGEQRLQESEERFRQLADNIPEGFLYQIIERPDGSGGFSYVSRSVEHLLGINPGEVAEDPTILYRMIDPEDLPRMRAEEEVCMRTRTPFQSNFRIRRRNGELRWLHCRSAPRALPDGGAVWDGIAIDVTERVLAAERLRESDRRKDEFLAMLAHELRNPLAPIRSGIEVLVAHGVQDEAIDLMREQVEHLVRLLDDLLDASRIMRNRIQLRKRPTDMTSVITRAVESVRPLMEAKQHNLTIAPQADPVWIDGDPVRLTQIVTNLLHNAAKYTPREGRIEVRLSEDNGLATLRVKDNGIGIPATLLPHLFELFTQADRSLERSQGGLGIGLTIVQHLITLHGGRVSAHSRGENQGAEFVVELPSIVPQDKVEALPSHPPAAFGDYRILIVEDNVGAARLLSQLLATFGNHHIDLAHDGPTGLEAARRTRPDIILLDIGLPIMNGFEVGRRLRADAAFDATLIVALTGYGSDEDRRRSKEAGFDMHIVKPPGIDLLEHVLAHPMLTASHRARTG